MGNLASGFKRFIANKNTVTILGIVAGIIILWFFYNMRVEEATSPVRVPIAKNSISGTDEITEDDLTYVDVNSEYISSLGAPIVTDPNVLIGKYVTTGTSIPLGGLFFDAQIIEKEDLPNTIFDDLPDDYTIFSIPVSPNLTYGNSIYPGDFIDLYITFSDDGLINFGKFIESIEVVGVRDSSQEDVFQDTGTGNSALLIFEVHNDLYDLLHRASLIGGIEIIPVARNSKYTSEAGSLEIKSQYIEDYINANSISRTD